MQYFKYFYRVHSEIQARWYLIFGTRERKWKTHTVSGFGSSIRIYKFAISRNGTITYRVNLNH